MEKKKGFWASLFAPKPCTCSCGTQIIEEFDKSTGASPNQSDSSGAEESGETAAAPDLGELTNRRLTSAN